MNSLSKRVLCLSVSLLVVSSASAVNQQNPNQGWGNPGMMNQPFFVNPQMANTVPVFGMNPQMANTVPVFGMNPQMANQPFGLQPGMNQNMQQVQMPVFVPSYDRALDIVISSLTSALQPIPVMVSNCQNGGLRNTWQGHCPSCCMEYALSEVNRDIARRNPNLFQPQIADFLFADFIFGVPGAVLQGQAFPLITPQNLEYIPVAGLQVAVSLFHDNRDIGMALIGHLGKEMTLMIGSGFTNEIFKYVLVNQTLFIHAAQTQGDYSTQGKLNHLQNLLDSVIARVSATRLLS